VGQKISIFRRILICIVLFALVLSLMNAPASKALAAASETKQNLLGWAPGFLGLAITSDGKTAYVPFSQDDSLLVADLSTFSVIDSIDVSSAGNQLDSGSAILTPDEKKLYVSNYAAGNVMVIDTAGKKVKSVLPLKPAGYIASSISLDGSRVYVPAADGGLYIINTVDDTYERVFVPGVIFGPVSQSRKDPDILYTPGILVKQESGAQKFGSTFFEFDLNGKSVKRTLSLPEDASKYPVTSARRLIISPDGKQAYFGRYIQGGADRGIGNFYVIDLNSFVIDTSKPINKGVSDFAVNEEKNKIYITGVLSGGGVTTDQSIHEWDMDAKDVVREIPVSLSSDQRTVLIDPANPDNLYMTEGDFNLLRKVEISSGKELGTVEFNKYVVQPFAMFKDGNKGYVLSSSNNIYIIDLQTGDIKNTLHIKDSFSGGGFYNGKIYLGGGDVIREVDPADGSITKVYPIGFNINPLYLTFYGNKMAAIDYEEGGMVGRQLLIFEADTMSVIKTIKLPPTPYGHKVLVSPDGKKLYLAGGTMWGTPTVVTILDGNTFETLNTVTIPAANVKNGATSFLEGDFDEEGRKLYLLGFTSVYKIDMDSDKLLGTIDMIDFLDARGGGWPPTGLMAVMLSTFKDKLYVVSGDAHSMYIYDFKNSSWNMKTVNIRGYFPTASAFSADRQYLFTVNKFTDSISMIDVNSGAVAKIIDLSQNKIIFQIGNPMMSVNGVRKEIDPGNGTKPVLVDGRTLIPIRALIETMGGKVGWDGNEQKVTIELGSDKVELRINQKTAIVNGVQKELDVPAQLINSRTMLPLRFVIENLGCTVQWDGAEQLITISY
jgi:YVTN family beta-propeller protein